jgi:hypothetical protein
MIDACGGGSPPIQPNRIPDQRLAEGPAFGQASGSIPCLAPVEPAAHEPAGVRTERARRTHKNPTCRSGSCLIAYS